MKYCRPKNVMKFYNTIQSHQFKKCLPSWIRRRWMCYLLYYIFYIIFSISSFHYDFHIFTCAWITKSIAPNNFCSFLSNDLIRCNDLILCLFQAVSTLRLIIIAYLHRPIPVFIVIKTHYS